LTRALRQAGIVAGLAVALPLSATIYIPDVAATPAYLEDEEPPEREQIPWNLGDIFENREEWDADRQSVLDRLPDLEAFQGRMGESPEVMLEALQTFSQIQLDAVRAYVYANLLFDENQNNGEAEAMTQQVDEMFAALGRATAWSNPEIVAMGEQVVEDFIASNPEAYERYRLQLLDTIRNAQHILSPEGEEIMAAAGILPGMPQQTYNLLVNADITWSTIQIDGEDVYLNQSGYSFNRANPDRAVREEVFDTFWGAWEQYESTVGQILNSHIQNQVFIARARGYDRMP